MFKQNDNIIGINQINTCLSKLNENNKINKNNKK